MRTGFHPICPHCGYEFDDEETWYSSNDNYVNTGSGDESTVKCHSCGDKFEIECEHVPMFYSEVIDEI